MRQLATDGNGVPVQAFCPRVIKNIDLNVSNGRTFAVDAKDRLCVEFVCDKQVNIHFNDAPEYFPIAADMQYGFGVHMDTKMIRFSTAEDATLYLWMQ